MGDIITLKSGRKINRSEIRESSTDYINAYKVECFIILYSGEKISVTEEDIYALETCI